MANQINSFKKGFNHNKLKTNKSSERFQSVKSSTIFPKADDLFYVENINPCWQKENAENIVMRNMLEKREMNKGFKRNFSQSNVFSKKEEYTNNKIDVQIHPKRSNDFHRSVNVLNPISSENYQKPESHFKRALSPLVEKMNRSTLFTSPYITKVKVPPSHPSFKTDFKKTVLRQASVKKQNFLKTSYNFLKNYF